MKENYIGLLNTDDEIQDFFLVKSIAVKIGANKKQYLDLLLGDNTGEITAKKWDIADTELPSLNEIVPGEVVKVKAGVTEWNGMQQLRVSKIRKAVPQDQLDMGDFIRIAPEDPVYMFGFLMELAESMKDEDFRKVSKAVLEENREKLLYYPAAVKNHHAERSGLLYHLKTMASMAIKYTEVYTFLNRDLLLCGVIIHDIEKLSEIESDENGIASGYSYEGQMLGHLVSGVKIVDRLGEKLGLSHEKLIMLEHMILSHHYEPEFGSPKKPLFPEAELLHYLDIVDARMYDMKDALFGTKGGEFSERVRTLDGRKLYKPTFEQE